MSVLVGNIRSRHAGTIGGPMRSRLSSKPRLPPVVDQQVVGEVGVVAIEHQVAMPGSRVGRDTDQALQGDGLQADLRRTNAASAEVACPCSPKILG